MFNTYRSHGKGDKTFLVSHVTLRNPIIKGAFDFVKKGASQAKTPLYQA